MQQTTKILRNVMIAMLSAFLLNIPYFIGKIQLKNSISIIERVTDQTDIEISDVCALMSLPDDWYNEPTYSDLYISGYMAIKQLF